MTRCIHGTELDGRCPECTVDPQDGNGWLPIADAPRDGAPIIGLYWVVPWANSHMKSRVVQCWWQPEFDAFISGCSKMQMHNGYTFDDGTTSKLHHPEIETPSHWMPFKEPSP